jgi:hypothetical protein
MKREWHGRKLTGNIDDGQDFPLLLGLVQLGCAIRLQQHSKHHRPSTGEVRQEDFAQLSRQSREQIKIRQGSRELVVIR